MSIFRKRSAASAPPAPPPAPGAPEPPLDDLLGDAQAHAFRAELEHGDWKRLHDFLDATREPDARFFYVETLAGITGRPDWLDEWCAARPGSAVPLLFRASHGRHWAWEARGSGLAQTVEQEAWPLFHERLIAADRDLERAAELDPEDPTPHALGLWAALGLSLGQAELLRRFGEVDRRHRWHLGAYRAMSQGMASKWGGSNERLLEFAMCFRLMRDYPAQLEQMDLIGPMITRLPWGYQGRPRAAYERAREMALTKARASG